MHDGVPAVFVRVVENRVARQLGIFTGYVRLVNYSIGDYVFNGVLKSDREDRVLRLDVPRVTEVVLYFSRRYTRGRSFAC